MPEWQPPGQLPRTAVEDTVLDLIATARSFDDAYGWISAAIGRRVQGMDTLRYGWPDATEHRCRTAAEIAAVLRDRGWTGTLRPCGPGCTAAPASRPRPAKAAPATQG